MLVETKTELKKPTLEERAEIVTRLRQEREDTPMVVLYETTGRPQIAIGFYFGVNGKDIDLRNHAGRIHGSALPLSKEYHRWEINTDVLINYQVLGPKKEKP